MAISIVGVEEKYEFKASAISFRSSSCWPLADIKGVLDLSRIVRDRRSLATCGRGFDCRRLVFPAYKFNPRMQRAIRLGVGLFSITWKRLSFARRCYAD